MTRAERSVDDYDELFTPIRGERQKTSGNQLGNPAEAVAPRIFPVRRPRAE